MLSSADTLQINVVYEGLYCNRKLKFRSLSVFLLEDMWELLIFASVFHGIRFKVSRRLFVVRQAIFLYLPTFRFWDADK